ncbi:hypothetical protein WA026_008293, partial [Henosepilachna vigintioctopunctata]
ELIRDIVDNTDLMEAIAKQMADTISARIDKTIERINLGIQSMHDEITIIKEENKDLKQKVDELEQDAKLEVLVFLWCSRERNGGFEENCRKHCHVQIRS